MTRSISLHAVTRTLAPALLGMALGACANAGMSAEHEVMTGANGMTVYTFDKDRPGESMCSGGCAELWPPVPAADVSGEDVGTITRSDGTRQATYDGKPLYYYQGDDMRGDMKGDGFKGVWHVVREDEEYGDSMDNDSGGNY